MTNLPEKIPQINSVELSNLVIKYDGAIKAIQLDYDALMARVSNAKKNGGLTLELDKELNNMLVSMKLSVEQMYNGRLIYTKQMDDIKGYFTGFEGLISPKQTDPKHPHHRDGMYVTIQRERDEYARQEKARHDQIAREQEARINKDKERLTLKSNAENIIRTSTVESIAKWKRQTNNILETATLETIDGVKDTINGVMVDSYSESALLTLLSSQARYHKPEEVKEIYNEACNMALQSEISQQVHSDTNNYLEYLQKSIPGKKAELEKIAAAGAAEKVRLEKEAADRAAAAQSQINFDLANKSADIQSEVSAKQQAGIAEVLFSSDAPPAAITGVRNACNIRVTSVKAFPSIMALWHRLKGIQLSVDEYEKVKVSSMISACEKNYMATGEKIDSPDIIYEDVVKTSARK